MKPRAGKKLCTRQPGAGFSWGFERPSPSALTSASLRVQQRRKPSGSSDCTSQSLERREELGGDGVGLADRPDRLDVHADRRGFREGEQRYVVAMRDVEVPAVVLEARLAVCTVRELDGFGSHSEPRAELLAQAAAGDDEAAAVALEAEALGALRFKRRKRRLQGAHLPGGRVQPGYHHLNRLCSAGHMRMLKPACCAPLARGKPARTKAFPRRGKATPRRRARRAPGDRVFPPLRLSTAAGRASP